MQKIRQYGTNVKTVNKPMEQNRESRTKLGHVQRQWELKTSREKKIFTQ